MAINQKGAPASCCAGTTTLREIRKKPVVPLYGFAAVWLIYCLFFPLYRLWHFILLLCIAFAGHMVLSLIFPVKTEYVKEPEKPVSTGNEEIDKLIAEGNVAVNEMVRLRNAIKDEGIRKKIDEIISVTEKIFKDVIDDPADYRQVKHFADFYLPTTIKLLNTYDRMGSLGSMGTNITGTMARIDAILDMTLEGYKKQFDALFANQALDIETDITVLKSLLKKEGLAEKDF